MVKQLDPGIANEILALIKQGFALTKQGDFGTAETYYLSAWEKIPEPKFELGRKREHTAFRGEVLS